MQSNNEAAPVVCLHTVPLLVTEFAAQLRDASIPVPVFHVLDEPLLESIRRSGAHDPAHTARLASHFESARRLDASVLFVTCSTLSPLVARMPEIRGLAVLRIDEPMMIEAAARAGSVTVIATNPTAMEPAVQMLHSFATSATEPQQVLVPGAFAAYRAGEFDRHDTLLIDAIAHCRSETILLAQASMARVYPKLDAERALAC